MQKRPTTLLLDNFFYHLSIELGKKTGALCPLYLYDPLCDIFLNCSSISSVMCWLVVLWLLSTPTPVWCNHYYISVSAKGNRGREGREEYKTRWASSCIVINAAFVCLSLERTSFLSFVDGHEKRGESIAFVIDWSGPDSSPFSSWNWLLCGPKRTTQPNSSRRKINRPRRWWWANRYVVPGGLGFL